MGKFQYFNGLKFTRDDKTGYYLNSTIRKRIHRYVWEFYNGEIPKGYHIHHIDHDKSNNDISNLKLIDGKEHVIMHGVERGLTHYDFLVQNLNEKARPKANEWHGSEEGRKWHSEHGKRTWENRNPIKKNCIQCNEEFECVTYRDSDKFCSNKCKSAWRRKEGLDDTRRMCTICNKDFIINKYRKTKTCSRECAGKLRSLNRS